MSKRILIVDDEPRYLRLLEANLRTEGYEVVTAQDGLQALEARRRRSWDQRSQLPSFPGCDLSTGHRADFAVGCLE